MKKLKSLSDETLEKAEILTSSQMKKVNGKDGGGASCTAMCNTKGYSVTIQCEHPNKCRAIDEYGAICYNPETGYSRTTPCLQAS